MINERATGPTRFASVAGSSGPTGLQPSFDRTALLCPGQRSGAQVPVASGDTEPAIGVRCQGLSARPVPASTWPRRPTDLQPLPTPTGPFFTRSDLVSKPPPQSIGPSHDGQKQR